MKNVSITAVGDICLGDSPKALGFGVKSTIQKKGTNHPFQKIKKMLTADIIFGNLEITLSERGLEKFDFNSEQLRGSPKMVHGLKYGGFNVVNIANNHSMQHGVETFRETIELLGREDISVVGIKSQRGYYSKPLIKKVNGLSIGFLGYALEKDRYAKEEDVLYAYYGSKQKILSDIQRLRDEVELLIISLHWGLEYMDRPSLTSIRLARDIVDAGADIILGHHPHVVQGMERYKKGIICYSLGNFVFDMTWNKLCYLGVIVKFFVKRNKYIEYNVVPIEINKDFQPEAINGKAKEEFYEYLNSASEKMKNEITGDPERNNLRYYLDYKCVRRRESFKANLFLLRTIPKTPISLIPGKLNYILKKMF